MLTAFAPAELCLGEKQLLRGELRLGAHCTERPEVIRINPIQSSACAKNQRSSTPGLRPMLSECADVYVGAQEYPLFTMSSLQPRLGAAATAARLAARGGILCSF